MPSLFSRIGDFLQKNRPWYKLPRILAMPALIEIRNDLREKNLVDTEEPPMPTVKKPAHDPVRTIDGTNNDLKCPMMGAAGRRFGRNFPLKEVFPDKPKLLKPPPSEVSQRLMTRTAFQPATILNLLAASWIQFMVHDWFVHKKGKPEDGVDIPLPDGGTMRLAPTAVDPAPAGSKRPPAYANENSHWWDASMIYGSDAATAARIRTGAQGKIRVDGDGRIPVDPATGNEVTGFTENVWIGLNMLHGLFASEHNAICDALRAAHPAESDQWYFDKARLINSALMAKIHTVEWTPAIVPHPVVKIAMNTNWNGITGDIQEVFEFLDNSEILGGIIGSKADHHAAPYSLTEEFVAVYRMHPLMPDDFTIRSVADDKVLETLDLPALSGRNGRKVFERLSIADLFYSFGRMHPGALRLHNYPRHLQNLVRDNGEKLDLAAIDVFRDRERGVPRYNRFRKLLRKDPVKNFEELTDNPVWREEIRAVYNNDIESVDLMTGLFCEPLPDGFGFSETAFRIFVLMASRRLKSDRFFTDDWRPEIYTPLGLEWVKKNTMLHVLKRHFPGVAPALDGVENAFHPWKKVE
ncbi:MAG: peroxidase [Acidobacteria bacterium]|nr:peroxidase [Acidobacteriota bacterium]